MSNDRYRIFVIICFYFLHLDASCIKTRSLSNSNVTQIFSENFFSEQTLTSNNNCNLIIESRSNGFFIFTIRVIELKNKDYPSELSFVTEQNSIPIHSRSQRVSIFVASKPLKIVYRSQHSLDHFLLEWTFVDRLDQSCPSEWKCNCRNECQNDRFTCPFCSLGTSDQCRSNEIWCLSSSNNRGFCASRNDLISCFQSTRSFQCDRIIPFYDQDGFINENHLIIGESLCLVLNSRIPIDLKFHQKLFIELLISEQNSTIFKSSIIIRMITFTRLSRLNLTWTVKHCPNDQILCSDQDEHRCYSLNQRCDGRWNCLNGDDELGCSHICPSTFLCPDLHHQTCFSTSDRCNGYPTCSSHFDEEFCSSAQCNSNNGSYLCRNNRCIYESWRCDGTNDCGDNSDEEFCPLHPHRRVITATVIGVGTFAIIFLLVLSCSCKLFSFRRSFRLFHRSTTTTTNNQNSDQPLAPPSYNQTIGLTDEQDERLALLMDHLRLAGFAEVINVSQSSTHGRPPLLNRESPPAYIPSEQTHPSSDTDDEKMLIP